jgi:acyl dehydratase
MACKIHFEDVKVGDTLPAWVRQTDLMHWNRYAAVNDEFIYIHMDDEVGREAANPQGAFGMGNLRFSYLHNMLRDWMGDEPEVVEMSVQYRAINQKNDVLTCTGTVVDKQVKDGQRLVRIEINVINQDGKGTTPGYAVVALPGRG